MTKEQLKEEAKKEFNKNSILDQTILLNWIRANTNITIKKEIRFCEILSEFLIDKIDPIIDKAYDEGEKEGKEKIKDVYVKYGCNCGEDLWQNARFENGEQNEMLQKIGEIIYEINDF